MTPYKFVTREEIDQLKQVSLYGSMHARARETLDRLISERDEALKELDNTTKCLIEEQKMREAYREAAINKLCDVFAESDADFLKGFPDMVRIPRKEVVTKHLDAEAAKLLEGKQ